MSIVSSMFCVCVRAFMRACIRHSGQVANVLDNHSEGPGFQLFCSQKMLQ